MTSHDLETRTHTSRQQVSHAQNHTYPKSYKRLKVGCLQVMPESSTVSYEQLPSPIQHHCALVSDSKWIQVKTRRGRSGSNLIRQQINNQLKKDTLSKNSWQLLQSKYMPVSSWLMQWPADGSKLVITILKSHRGCRHGKQRASHTIQMLFSRFLI